MSEMMSFEAFCERFSSVEKCVEALFRSRWPQGFKCPICRHPHYYLTRTRRLPLYECKSCRHQTSLIAGTVMAGSSTSLPKWFKAIYLLSQPGGISSVRLAELLEVTYKTAWLMSHKIREAMRASEHSVKLEDIVRVEAFGYGISLFPDAIQPLLMGGSFDEEGNLRRIKLQQPDPDHVRLPERTIAKAGYEAFQFEGVKSSKVTRVLFYAKAHPVLGSFRREIRNWLKYTFCGIGAKHLQAYLNEFSFRANEGFVEKGGSVFPQLLAWCATTAKITYSYLTRPRRTLPVAWHAFESKGKWKSYHLRKLGA
jgi:Transposase and inactivated derivatives